MISVRRLTRRTVRSVQTRTNLPEGELKYNKTRRTGRRDYEDDIQQCIRSDRAYPMIRLNRMNSPENAEVLVKFEGLNVGGSIKTRTAFNMIEEAETQGLLTKDTHYCELTSGKPGHWALPIGAVKGYRTIIIMPDSVSEERRKLVQHYGQR